ncbi:MAG: RiPP maturation radical SAM C-methyltransferase [Micromonosporaceae bacterium]
MRVALVNMPFADWHRPSFALSQLAALVRREHGDEVHVQVFYLNQDIADFFDVSSYTALAGHVDHLTTGLGDWLFRDIAFPELPENSQTYFHRYYLGKQWNEFRAHILDRRRELRGFCESLIDRYELASFDLVGLTSMFAQTTASIAVARLIKDRNPAALTVMGGANCEPPMGREIVAGTPAIDFVFSGPALHTFPDFVGHLLAEDREGLHAIPGVLSTRNCDDPALSARVGRDRDIDDFIEPYYADFVASLRGNRTLSDAVAAGTEPILYFETSRGCWWGQRSHCTFCGLNGLTMNYRTMEAALARKQLETLFSYAPWCTTYACTDNIMPRNYPRDVFAHLDPPANASIFFEVKVPVSEHDLKIMARGAVNRVQPGIESLATETLALMGKGTTSFQNIQFLKSCLRHDIEPAWNLLIGFPGEQEAVYRKYAKDIPLLFHLPPPSGVYMVRFDRYSPYLAKADEYGLNLKPMDFYGLIYPFGDEGIANFAYFFADENVSPYMVNAATWRGQLDELTTQWNQRWRAGTTAGVPRLALITDDGDRSVVYDSRYGTVRQHPVDEVGVAILRRLSSPLRPARLAADLGLDPAETGRRLSGLRELGLLFEEGDRVISVVVIESEDVDSDEEAPRPTLPLVERR